jgi:hypothetical protein
MDLITVTPAHQASQVNNSQNSLKSQNNHFDILDAQLKNKSNLDVVGHLTVTKDDKLYDIDINGIEGIENKEVMLQAKVDLIERGYMIRSNMVEPPLPPDNEVYEPLLDAFDAEVAATKDSFDRDEEFSEIAVGPPTDENSAVVPTAVLPRNIEPDDIPEVDVGITDVAQGILELAETMSGPTASLFVAGDLEGALLNAIAENATPEIITTITDWTKTIASYVEHGDMGNLRYPGSETVGAGNDPYAINSIKLDEADKVAAEHDSRLYNIHGAAVTKEVKSALAKEADNIAIQGFLDAGGPKGFTAASLLSVSNGWKIGKDGSSFYNLTDGPQTISYGGVDSGKYFHSSYDKEAGNYVLTESTVPLSGYDPRNLEPLPIQKEADLGPAIEANKDENVSTPEEVEEQENLPTITEIDETDVIQNQIQNTFSYDDHAAIRNIAATMLSRKKDPDIPILLAMYDLGGLGMSDPGGNYDMEQLQLLAEFSTDKFPQRKALHDHHRQKVFSLNQFSTPQKISSLLKRELGNIITIEVTGPDNKSYSVKIDDNATIEEFQHRCCNVLGISNYEDFTFTESGASLPTHDLWGRSKVIKDTHLERPAMSVLVRGGNVSKKIFTIVTQGWNPALQTMIEKQTEMIIYDDGLVVPKYPDSLGRKGNFQYGYQLSQHGAPGTRDYKLTSERGALGKRGLFRQIDDGMTVYMNVKLKGGSSAEDIPDGLVPSEVKVSIPNTTGGKIDAGAEKLLAPIYDLIDEDLSAPVDNMVEINSNNTKFGRQVSPASGLGMKFSMELAVTNSIPQQSREVSQHAQGYRAFVPVQRQCLAGQSGQIAAGSTLDLMDENSFGAQWQAVTHNNWCTILRADANAEHRGGNTKLQGIALGLVQSLGDTSNSLPSSQLLDMAKLDNRIGKSTSTIGPFNVARIWVQRVNKSYTYFMPVFNHVQQIAFTLGQSTNTEIEDNLFNPKGNGRTIWASDPNNIIATEGNLHSGALDGAPLSESGVIRPEMGLIDNYFDMPNRQSNAMGDTINIGGNPRVSAIQLDVGYASSGNKNCPNIVARADTPDMGFGCFRPFLDEGTNFSTNDPVSTTRRVPRGWLMTLVDFTSASAGLDGYSFKEGLHPDRNKDNVVYIFVRVADGAGSDRSNNTLAATCVANMCFPPLERVKTRDFLDLDGNHRTLKGRSARIPETGEPRYEPEYSQGDDEYFTDKTSRQLISEAISKKSQQPWENVVFVLDSKRTALTQLTSDLKVGPNLIANKGDMVFNGTPLTFTLRNENGADNVALEMHPFGDGETRTFADGNPLSDELDTQELACENGRVETVLNIHRNSPLDMSNTNPEYWEQADDVVLPYGDWKLSAWIMNYWGLDGNEQVPHIMRSLEWAVKFQGADRTMFQDAIAQAAELYSMQPTPPIIHGTTSGINQKNEIEVAAFMQSTGSGEDYDKPTDGHYKSEGPSAIHGAYYSKYNKEEGWAITHDLIPLPGTSPTGPWPTPAVNDWVVVKDKGDASMVTNWIAMGGPSNVDTGIVFKVTALFVNNPAVSLGGSCFILPGPNNPHGMSTNPRMRQLNLVKEIPYNTSVSGEDAGYRLKNAFFDSSLSDPLLNPNANSRGTKPHQLIISPVPSARDTFDPIAVNSNQGIVPVRMTSRGHNITSTHVIQDSTCLTCSGRRLQTNGMNYHYEEGLWQRSDDVGNAFGNSGASIPVSLQSLAGLYHGEKPALQSPDYTYASTDNTLSILWGSGYIEFGEGGNLTPTGLSPDVSKVPSEDDNKYVRQLLERGAGNIAYMVRRANFHIGAAFETICNSKVVTSDMLSEGNTMQSIQGSLGLDGVGQIYVQPQAQISEAQRNNIISAVRTNLVDRILAHSGGNGKGNIKFAIKDARHTNPMYYTYKAGDYGLLNDGKLAVSAAAIGSSTALDDRVGPIILEKLLCPAGAINRKWVDFDSFRGVHVLPPPGGPGPAQADLRAGSTCMRYGLSPSNVYNSEFNEQFLIDTNSDNDNVGNPWFLYNWTRLTRPGNLNRLKSVNYTYDRLGGDWDLADPIRDALKSVNAVRESNNWIGNKVYPFNVQHIRPSAVTPFARLQGKMLTLLAEQENDENIVLADDIEMSLTGMDFRSTIRKLYPGTFANNLVQLPVITFKDKFMRKSRSADARHVSNLVGATGSYAQWFLQRGVKSRDITEKELIATEPMTLMTVRVDEEIKTVRDPTTFFNYESQTDVPFSVFGNDVSLPASSHNLQMPTGSRIFPAYTKWQQRISSFDPHLWDDTADQDLLDRYNALRDVVGDPETMQLDVVIPAPPVLMGLGLQKNVTDRLPCNVALFGKVTGTDISFKSLAQGNKGRVGYPQVFTGLKAPIMKDISYDSGSITYDAMMDEFGFGDGASGD